MTVSIIKKFFGIFSFSPFIKEGTEVHDSELYKIKSNLNVLKFIGTILCILLIFFGLFSIYNKNTSQGIVDFSSALILFLFLIFVNKTNKYIVLINTIIGFLVILSIYFFQSAPEGTGLYLWTLTVPLFLIFFLDIGRGIIITLLYLIANVTLILTNLTRYEYSEKFIVRYSGVFVTILLMSYVYRKIQEKTHTVIKTTNRELNNAVQRLSKTKKDLQQSESKYRILVEKWDDGIAILKDLKFVYTNEKLNKILGFSNEELIGKSLITLVPPEEKNSLTKKFKYLKTEGEQVRRFEIPLSVRNGHSLDVELTVNSIMYKGIPSDLVFVRDITEKKYIEQEKMKFSKLESFQIVANGVNHDFNNILTIIMGNLELIKLQSKDKSKFQKPLKKIEEASGRASKLLEELYLFSSNAVKNESKEEIGEIIVSITSQLEKENDSTIKINIKDNLWPLRCDRKQIQIAIRNILINSIDASSKGALIEIDVDNFINNRKNIRHLKEGNYLRISIADSGQGIPRKNLDKIFDPYFTTKEEVTEKGIGLGLAIANKIIVDHGGVIIVTSKSGFGTTFNIFLPADEKSV